MTVSFLRVDEQLAQLKRGVVDLVSEADLAGKLERSRKTGKPLAIKAGFDPSSSDLHLGHTVLLRKMRHFQRLGHRVIFLVGDFTAMIGDPTGKKATRPQLTREQVLEHAETYARQVFRILDRDATVVEWNSRWLGPLGSEGLIRLAAKWTLARMMERDDFRTRYQTQQPISLHELLYPLVQAKDSVEMAKLPELGCDVELGGHDQIFNLLVGRDLMREEGLEPQVCLTVPLLVGLDGSDKMSKSLGNSIAVEDPARRRSTARPCRSPTRLMWDWLLLLTETPEAEIAGEEARGRRGRAPSQEGQTGTGPRPGRPVSRHRGGAWKPRQSSSGSSPAAACPTRCRSIPRRSARNPLHWALGRGRPGHLRARRHSAWSTKARSRSTASRSDDWSTESSTPRPEPYLIKVGKRRFLRVRVTRRASAERPRVRLGEPPTPVVGVSSRSRPTLSKGSSPRGGPASR